MDDRLRELLDVHEIIDTINRLFIGTDRRDWPEVRSCFAETVLFDMTSLAGGAPSTLTPAQITGAWEAGLAPLQAIHHQAGNYRVNIEGDTADAFCYGIASHYRPTRSGVSTRSFVGSYDFHLVRRGDGWRIDAFRFNLKYVEGNLRLEDDAP